jgi:hypothetical protein
MGVVTQNPEYPLGGFDWLDRNANLRQWFANWLTSHWTQIYRESVRDLHSKADWKNFDRMEKAIKQLAVKLPRFPTAKQISAVDAKARKFNFKTTRDHIENELDFFLTRAGQQPEHAPAFKASPWCNHFANEEHIFEQAGTNLPYKLYPRDPDMRLVLGSRRRQHRTHLPASSANRSTGVACLGAAPAHHAGTAPRHDTDLPPYACGTVATADKYQRQPLRIRCPSTRFGVHACETN